MFIQSQALDNKSEDLYVLDGEVVTQSDPRTYAWIRIAARVRPATVAGSAGAARATWDDGHIAVEFRAAELDSLGRPATVLVLMTDEELSGATGDALASEIMTWSEQIQRTLDPSTLLRALADLPVPKVPGGLLRRLLIRFLRWLRSSLWI